MANLNKPLKKKKLFSFHNPENLVKITPENQVKQG